MHSLDSGGKVGGDSGIGGHWNPSLHFNGRICLEFGLTIVPLMGLLHLEGTGGISFPYKGYIKANLIIPVLP